MKGPVRIIVANLNKDLDGDRLYLAYLRDQLAAGGPAVLLLQERGHGLESTKIMSYGITVATLPTWVVGSVGVHRGVGRGWLIIDGALVRLFDVHGLHVPTSGTPAQDGFYELLARRARALARRGRRSIWGGDFNRFLELVAQLLGGVAHGEPDDKEGLVTRGVTVVGGGSSDVGIRRGWTDHPERWIDVRVRRDGRHR